MNTPSSRQGNLTRYIVYLVLYLIVIGVKKLALLNDHVNKIGYFFFLLCALFTLYFYIRQFNREQRFFEKKNHDAFISRLWIYSWCIYLGHFRTHFYFLSSSQGKCSFNVFSNNLSKG